MGHERNHFPHLIVLIKIRKHNKILFFSFYDIIHFHNKKQLCLFKYVQLPTPNLNTKTFLDVKVSTGFPI